MSFPAVSSVFLIALLLAAVDSFGEDLNDPIRLQFTEDDAPRSVLFGFFIDDIFETSLYPHDDDYHALRSGASDSTNLQAVFDYIVILWVEKDKEYGDSMMRMLCSVGSPRPRGRQLFKVFDSLDDVRHAIHHKYYAIAKSELFAQHSFDLDVVLENYTIAFTETWRYSEKIYGGSVERAQQVADKICDKGHVNEFFRSTRAVE